MYKLLKIMPFYAVARGRAVGIFLEWHMCDSSVRFYKGARYKKFNTKIEAIQFLKEHNVDYKESDDSSDQSSQSSSASSKAPTEFWPDDVEYDKNDESLLLTAFNEVEGIPIIKNEKDLKRKQNEDSPTKSKCPKDDSEVPIIIGMKKYCNINFPIDCEGYVVCYTDGSCEGNGQSIAAAGFGVYFTDNHPLNTAKPITGRPTNNVGEIQASIYAIKLAIDLGIQKLCIVTDSQFLINSITLWMKSWKAKGWRKKDGDMVKNVEDFKELDDIISKSGINIKWNHVRGHIGVKGNEEADKLARKGAQMYRENKPK